MRSSLLHLPGSRVEGPALADGLKDLAFVDEKAC